MSRSATKTSKFSTAAINQFLTHIPSIAAQRRRIRAHRFETHSVSFESEAVSLSYHLLYPVSGPSRAALHAFQSAVLTDCFDPALAACDPLPNPAVLIASRVAWYQNNQRPADTVQLPENWRIATDFVNVAPDFVSWSVTATSGSSIGEQPPVTLARILDCEGGWVVPAAHLWQRDSLSRVRTLIAQCMNSYGTGERVKLTPRLASRLSISNAYADAEGITFVYNPGELGPRENGGYSAIIPWREVEPLLAPRYRGIATTNWNTIQPRPQIYHPN